MVSIDSMDSFFVGHTVRVLIFLMLIHLPKNVWDDGKLQLASVDFVRGWGWGCIGLDLVKKKRRIASKADFGRRHPDCVNQPLD